MSYLRSVIKTIQRGTISFSGVGLTATATITAVDTSKSSISLLGTSGTGGSGGNVSDVNFTLVLTNTTTLTATRVGNNSITQTVAFQVVEFL